MESHLAYSDSGMKILYYSSHPHLRIEDQTGYGTHMREMIAAFESQGHKVRFLIAGQQTVKTSTKQKSKTRQSPLKSILKFLLPQLIWETIKDLQLIRLDHANKRVLNSLLNEFKPDAIYERSHYAMVSGVKVAKDRSIHHILEVNSPNVEERIKLSGRSLMTRRASRMDRWAFSNTDHVLTVSTYLAKHLDITRIAKRWSVTPNAIRPGQQEESTLMISRQSIRIDDSAVLLGFIGSIFPWHGVDLIIDSVAHLRKRGRNLQAIIVGDGAILKDLESLTEFHNLKEAIHFVGSVPQCDTFAYTQLCDILVMPRSNAYGSPVKIFEYGLMRKPCIVPNTAPVREVFQNGVHGWVIDPSIMSLTSAIIEIMDDPSKSSNAAVNWQTKVLEDHTWHVNANQALAKRITAE